VVKRLPSIHKALGLIPDTTRKKKKNEIKVRGTKVEVTPPVLSSGMPIPWLVLPDPDAVPP
jgi:hypothetical protein